MHLVVFLTIFQYKLTEAFLLHLSVMYPQPIFIPNQHSIVWLGSPTVIGERKARCEQTMDLEWRLCSNILDQVAKLQKLTITACLRAQKTQPIACTTFSFISYRNSIYTDMFLWTWRSDSMKWMRIILVLGPIM